MYAHLGMRTSDVRKRILGYCAYISGNALLPVLKLLHVRMLYAANFIDEVNRY